MPLKPPADMPATPGLARRLRLLPVVMAACGALLVVKVTALATETAAAFGEPSAATADAAAAAVAKIAPAAGTEEKPEASPAASPAATGDKPAEAPATEPAANKGAGSEDPNAPADAGFLSRSEINLLQDLASRRQQLEARSNELDTRERLLMATEQRIDKKIERLKNMESDIKALVRVHDAREEAQLQSLVKIYESMKPKEAARILGKLDLPVLIDVLTRMKEKKVADVLAMMDSKVATEVTAELAERRAIPVNSEDRG